MIQLGKSGASLEEVKLEKNGSTPKLERRCLAVLENVTLIFHQQPALVSGGAL
ncbi:hypothetical protein ACVMB3_002878 [Sinorhizobium meliloti]|uniref:hypothetical protein n=1 Tax=Rhizobium meliloti TaxID=382 RepID=UPI0013E361D9|nr:hypothetical protein [Sinorhizobium meliloti]MDW9709937.1 hypothetical protein [Sinorhizobium meliloti]MDW9740882.1 hypothetical protein [Sinorhizobium meliloti]MDW9746780.1 hypothetical protein [Sinorhizobium meliloti]MDW9794952.1 hypothetical protein [Sinorhizobium meliloti]